MYQPRSLPFFFLLMISPIAQTLSRGDPTTKRAPPVHHSRDVSAPRNGVEPASPTCMPPSERCGIAALFEGAALVLEELIRAAAEGQIDRRPDTVIAMLQARIGHLPAGARRAVLAASIFGQT